MSDTTRAVLLGIFTLSSCIWVGGYVAIVVVVRAANRSLEPAQRVAFFRALGRGYLVVGGPALVVALGTGAGLLSDHGWDALLIATVAVAAVLVLSLAVGVAQARRMTRLRAAALASAQDVRLSAGVRRGARAAAALRGTIGLLTLTLIALGSLLAT